MKRRLFNLLAAVSMVMLATTAILWIGSHISPWELSIRRAHGDFHLQMWSRDGHFYIGETHHFEYWLIGYWKLLILFLLLPARQTFVWRRAKVQSKVGLCIACGYNLTGNVSGICPECGTAIPTAKGALA